MSGQPFQIPGLGQAKPNETLPSESFAPDLLAAAASLVGVDGLGLHGAANGAQVGTGDKTNEQQIAPVESAEAAQAKDTVVEPAKATTDVMELDKSEPSANHQPSLDGPSADAQSASNDQDKAVEEQHKAEDTKMTDEGAAPPSPHVAHALEAALDGLLQTAGATSEAAAPADGMDGVEGGAPEWEADSSPYESSSESDSSDSSSDDDSDEEGGYQLLGIEETARLLMAEMGDGDGDGGAKGGKGVGGGQVRTKNEVPEEPLPKPEVTISEDMRIEPLGLVQFVVERTIVVQSQTPGEVQALDTGTVLCRADRTVIGVLADTIGNVRSPMYTVGFASEEEIKDLELQVGTEIFYSIDHAKYVFTEELKQVKGTDASNLHDEELPPDEMEFSDDEKEMEYKRQLKAKKRGNKPGRGGRDQSRDGHPHGNQPGSAPLASSGSGLNYDEDEDGPYKPLSRPANFGQGLPPSLPQLPPKPEMGFGPPRGGQGYRGGRGDFRGDHRGGRGRGGGGRGRGGGDRRHDRGGYGGPPQRSYGASSSPPHSYPNPRPAQQQQQPPQPAQPPQNPHLPPPPFGASQHPIHPPPPPPNQWSPAGSPYVPPPPPIVPHLYGQAQGQPGQPAAAQGFNFNYQAWQQNQATHAYPAYGQQQGHTPPVPQPPQHQHQQPSQNAYRAPVPAPAWPPAGVPAPPSGAYVNPAFFAGLQQGHVPQAPVPPPPQQGYWGQPPHGAYGQGNK
jgi:H/ACA ribonucleoprotein complex non-core subunit NAF1